MNQDLRVSFGKASSFLQAGKKAEALALLKPILAQQPDNTEAWWLAAHAAPTDEATVYACQKVLAAKPDYVPARQLFIQARLTIAEKLLRELQTAEALAIVRPILTDQPENIEALWLFARAVPTSVDAIAACEKILRLEPQHQQAQRMIDSRVNQLAVAELRRRDRAQNMKPRSRPWMISLLVGLIGLLMGGLLITRLITGKNFGLPQLEPKKVHNSLGTLRQESAAPAQIDVLPADGQREYEFIADANSFLLAMVVFPAGNGNAGRALKLIDSSGKVIATGDESGASSGKMVILQADLPQAGRYVLQLTGITGVAEGTYQLQMHVEAIPQ